MPRYIDADDFAERLLKKWDTADAEKKAEIVAVIACVVTPILVGTPTADVEPVRHGKWLKGDMPTYGGYKCSVCKANTVHYQANYCPNCGTKMELEVQHD